MQLKLFLLFMRQVENLNFAGDVVTHLAPGLCKKIARSALITGRRFLFFARPRRICYRMKNRNVQLRVSQKPTRSRAKFCARRRNDKAPKS